MLSGGRTAGVADKTRLQREAEDAVVPELQHLMADVDDIQHQPSLDGSDTKQDFSVTTTRLGGPSNDYNARPDTSRSNNPLREIQIISSHEVHYRVYRRRYIGLAQLVLLNIIVSWDWLTFAAVSTTSSHFFGVSVRTISWLSTAFLFAFVAISPATIWVLNKGGPRASILVSSALVLVGNWIRYGGVRAEKPSFATVMVGQIIIGFAQPFVLAAPTRYSSLWFSDKGRVSATALASLANPFGGALGQLIGPLWATNKSGIPNMVLYTAIISTVATLPAPFIPKAPPTPPSALAASEKLDLRQAFRQLPSNGSFWLILIPFGIFVGLFNAISSLLNQILYPYGFSETDAGISGALLIVVGLVASAVVSPIVDHTKQYLSTIKLIVPSIAILYIVFIFMPATRTVAGPWLVCALLGATSFSLLPCALEFTVLATHPVAPELSSTICWTVGQLLGALFIIIMDGLQGGWSGEPKNAMTRALIFQAVIAVLAVPFPMWLGIGKRRRDGIAFPNITNEVHGPIESSGAT